MDMRNTDDQTRLRSRFRMLAANLPLIQAEAVTNVTLFGSPIGDNPPALIALDIKHGAGALDAACGVIAEY